MRFNFYKFILLWLFVLLFSFVKGMTVTVWMNEKVIPWDKLDVIVLTNDTIVGGINFQIEDERRVLPTYDSKRVQTVSFIINYKEVKYLSSVVQLGDMNVASNECSIQILTNKKSKKKYLGVRSRRGHGDFVFSEADLKNDWIVVKLCCNEGPVYYKKKI